MTPKNVSSTLTFLHFNDLDACLAPHWDRVRSESEDGSQVSTVVKESSRIARLATLVKDLPHRCVS